MSQWNWRDCWNRRWVRVTLIVVAVLLALHLILPFAIAAYVRRTLNRIPGYTAHLDWLHVNLFRGAYQIHNLKLHKLDGDIPVPFFQADTVDLSLEWKALFDGTAVGEISLNHARLNFVNAPDPADKQTEIDKSWMERVKELFPVKINRFDVKNGEIHFRDFHREPNVDLELTNLTAVAVNLTNSKKIAEDLVATIDAAGDVVAQGKLKVHLKADPFAEQPTFELEAEMTDVSLPAWNDFLRAYGNFDVRRGQFSVYTEIKVDHGHVTGYVKPLLHDVHVAYWKEVKHNIFRAAWEGLVAGIAELLTNQPRDQIATRIPLSGELDNPNMGILPTIGQLLRNAFIKALFPGLEHSVGPDEEKA